MSSREYYLIGLLVLLLIYLFIEWRKGSAQQQPPSIYDLIDLARVFVAAADQMMPNVDGNQKLTWVMTNLNRAGLFPHIDPVIVRAAIEASVHMLKRSQANGTPSR